MKRHSAAPAPALRPRRRRLAEIVNGSPNSAPPSARTCWPTSRRYAWCSTDEGELAGLSDSARAAVRAAAEERGLAGKHVITLSRSSIEPFLQTSSRRDLREKAFAPGPRAANGGGSTDNKAIIGETISLAPSERASSAIRALRIIVSTTPWRKPPRRSAICSTACGRRRAGAPSPIAMPCRNSARTDGDFAIAAWDWRYYAEKLRKARCDIDEAEITQYLRLDNMIEAAFDTARRLFGLTFRELHDVPVWHPDVRVWECPPPTALPGLFFGDYFARPRSAAAPG